VSIELSDNHQAPNQAVARQAKAEESHIAPSCQMTEAFAWRVHAYLNEYVRFADTKAAAVIAWSAALISVLFSRNSHAHFMSGPAFSNITLGSAALSISSLLAFVLLALAVGAAFWCVKPSLWSRDNSKVHEKGSIYWEQIRAHDDAELFSATLLRKTPEQLLTECADHIFVLAGIAQHKYWWVDWSIRLATVGSLLAGLVALCTL